MKKHLITAIVALLFSLNSFSQENTNRPELLSYQNGLSIETFYQSDFGLALGGILAKNIGYKGKPNYSVGIYGDVIFGNGLIAGPRLKLSCNYLGIFGLNLNFSNYYRYGVSDFRITPEINFSLNGIANVFAGYSLNVSDEAIPNFSEFRVGLNLVLVNKSKF